MKVSRPFRVSDLWRWTSSLRIDTRREAERVLEQLARAWPNELEPVPSPVATGGAVGSRDFRGQYVTPSRAAARLTMHASIETAPEGHRVQIELEAVPDPAQFLIAIGAALLLPALALVADALEPRQALQCWLAFVVLVGAMQWIVAGVILRRMSRNLTTSLGDER